MHRVLAPEAALCLIMEDRELVGEDGAKIALAVLRESSSYGIAMFPDDAEDKITEGDRLAMKRARERRMEIMVEEGRCKTDEKIEIEQLEMGPRLRPRPRPRPRTTVNATHTPK